MSLDDLDDFPLVAAAGFAQAREGNVGIVRATECTVDQSQRLVALLACSKPRIDERESTIGPLLYHFYLGEPDRKIARQLIRGRGRSPR